MKQFTFTRYETSITLPTPESEVIAIFDDSISTLTYRITHTGSDKWVDKGGQTYTTPKYWMYLNEELFAE